VVVPLREGMATGSVAKAAGVQEAKAAAVAQPVAVALHPSVHRAKVGAKVLAKVLAKDAAKVNNLALVAKAAVVALAAPNSNGPAA